MQVLAKWLYYTSTHMSDDHIDISQINSDFNENTEPLDQNFLRILKAAYQAQIHCRRALVNFDLIVPFSDFQPVIADDYRKYFVAQVSAGTPPKIYLYQKEGKLIMSDDYAAYYLYKEHALNPVPCVIVGFSTPREGIQYIGGPYILQPPSAEVIN